MGFDNARAKLWNALFGESLEPRLVATAFTNADITQTSEILNYGDTVHVNFLGPVNVFDYEENQAMNGPQILDSTDATLVIDKKKAFNFFVDAVDEAQVRPEIMEQAMKSATTAVAKTIDSNIFNTIKNAVPTANKIGADIPVMLTAENAYSFLVQLKTILDSNNVPDEGRKLAIRSEVEGVLLNDDKFVKAGVPESEKRLENGLIIRILGFDIYRSENVPAGKIIASIPMATTHVHQLNRLSLYEPDGLFGTAAKGLNVFGSKVFYPAATAMINYTLDEYVEVKSPTGNPKTKGYFEIVDAEYVATEDESVDNSKTYYEKK